MDREPPTSVMTLTRYIEQPLGKTAGEQAIN